MTTFFVWEIFINKNNMNFQATFGEFSGTAQEQRVITASNWSTCFAYCEGVGLPIITLQLLSNVNIVQQDLGTNNCYQSTIKVNGVSLQYFVWANDYTSFNTWLNTLTNPVLQNLQNSNKLYATV